MHVELEILLKVISEHVEQKMGLLVYRDMLTHLSGISSSTSRRKADIIS